MGRCSEYCEPAAADRHYIPLPKPVTLAENVLFTASILLIDASSRYQLWQSLVLTIAGLLMFGVTRPYRAWPMIRTEGVSRLSTLLTLSTVAALDYSAVSAQVADLLLLSISGATALYFLVALRPISALKDVYDAVTSVRGAFLVGALSEENAQNPVAVKKMLHNRHAIAQISLNQWIW